ncbi:hypothetical protein DPMN_179926 [Dreissena polymorpha]|uniref:Uncharacterized protein n=1 Tax=Dreissena polymorpha TaxID=45954 RepID=A0A9D4EDR7_DREPO|nr:hypothetical protein DPMN_179926 [Dreissena polymorpha]
MYFRQSGKVECTIQRIETEHHDNVRGPCYQLFMVWEHMRTNTTKKSHLEWSFEKPRKDNCGLLFSGLSLDEIKKASAAPREYVSTVVCYHKRPRMRTKGNTSTHVSGQGRKRSGSSRTLPSNISFHPIGRTSPHQTALPDSIDTTTISSLSKLEELSIELDELTPCVWEALHGLNIKSLTLSRKEWGELHAESLTQLLSSLKRLETLGIGPFHIAAAYVELSDILPAKEFKMYFRQLEIDECTIQRIETEHHGNVREQCYQLFMVLERMRKNKTKLSHVEWSLELIHKLKHHIDERLKDMPYAKRLQ